MKKVLLFAIIALSINAFAQNQKQFWGMAFGGQNNAGVIFKTDASGNNEMVKHNFIDGGGNPYGSLVRASNGNLYGMTYYGGANNVGSLFQYDPRTWTFTIRYDFDFLDGRYPEGSLIQATDGMLYGMATEGGNNTNYDNGVIFKFNPQTNTYTKLYDFDAATSGSVPYGALMQASDGKLYGMTHAGGVYDFGVLFQFDISTGILNKKVDFAGITNGSSPYGSLVQASDGKLYGMTTTGGLNSEGVLFQFDPVSSVFTKKLDFDGPVNGGEPYGSLIKATDNKLYGFTSNGGDHSNGVLFQYDPVTSSLAKKLDFYGAETGSYPYGSFIQGFDSNLYALTSAGGANDFGVIFQYNPITSAFTKKLDFNESNGRNPQYTNLIEIPVTIATSPVGLINCVGSSLNIPFTIEGAYDAGNVFTAQLSDVTGSFASPLAIGSITSYFAGSVNGVIPANTPPGNGYRIRIVGSNPLVIGSDNGSNITINALPNVNTTVNGLTITVNQSGATYQWLNCNTAYSQILGETHQSYTATANGSYAVAVTMNGNGCVATSTCVNITNVGIDEIASDNQFTVYPNPGNGQFTVSSQRTISAIEVYNLFGVRLYYADYKFNQQSIQSIDLTGYAKGIYFINVYNGSKHYTCKVFVK